MIDPPIQNFLDFRNNKNSLQKGGFSFKDKKLSCLCAMLQGKNDQRLRTIFFINVNKNCPKVEDNFSNNMKTTVSFNVKKTVCKTFSVSATMSPCRGVSAMGLLSNPKLDKIMAMENFLPVYCFSRTI